MVGYTFSGTNNGVFRDSTATAFKISVRGISIFKVAGGKVLQEHMVWDTNALLEQLRPRTAETGPGPTGMPIWPPKIGEPLIP